MKKGDIVNIYEDPVTEKKLEGKARIIQKESDLNAKQGLYTVEFLGWEGIHMQRIIKEAAND